MISVARPILKLQAAAVALGLAAAATAQGFPDRPIQVIVPLAAGSTADILIRTIGPELQKALGQPVVVENRPGAGGAIAMKAVMAAAPNGYTLALGSTSTWGINVPLYAKLGYDPLKDFVPVAFLAGGSNVLIVKGDSPYQSVADLVAKMKAAPGSLTFSSGGSGTTHHLSSELLKYNTRTFATHIPYRGAPQGTFAVASGEVDFAFYNTPSVLSLVKAGKLKALAVTSAERSPLLPNVPTMQEAGIPNYHVSVDFGFMAPAGTPPDIITRLNAEARKVLKDPAIRQKLADAGFDNFQDLGAEQFGRFITGDIAKWTPLVKASGATAD